jgi:hypothetical protein
MRTSGWKALWYTYIPNLIIVMNALLIVYSNSRHEMTWVKNLVSLLVSSPLVILTLTNGKVLE